MVILHVRPKTTMCHHGDVSDAAADDDPYGWNVEAELRRTAQKRNPDAPHLKHEATRTLNPNFQADCAIPSQIGTLNHERPTRQS